MLGTLTRLAACLLASATIGAGLSAQQTSETEVVILSPADGTYVSGRMIVSVGVQASGVRTVLIYADGEQLCSLTNGPFDCEWDAGPLVNEHQIRVVASFEDGHRVVRSVRTKGVGFAESVNVDVVQVTATVGDGHGHFVKGLPQSSFHLWDEGRPQKVTHFESEDVPLEMVVALDISGSMMTSMPALKQAAKEFFAALSPKDKTTVLAFNDSIFTLVRDAAGPAGRDKALDRLAAWGHTVLYDVILRGIEMLGRQTGRKALVVFTAGEDQGSRATIEEVERRLQASDVTLYMIGEGQGQSMQPLKDVMRRLAQPTGGRAVFLNKIDELRHAFADLLDELSNQYLLGYSPSNNKRDGTLHRIRVEVDGHQVVRARNAYRAAAAEEK